MSQTIAEIPEIAPHLGKVLLIVNVASQCGYTYQYEGLEDLQKKYASRGFTVLAFPCNQFGNQEPGSDSEIQSFCKTHFDVTFPVFKKINVNGAETHPLYRILKKEKRGIFFTEAIKWNFTKFLVDRKGNVIARYGSQTKPEQISSDIEKLI